MADPLPDLALAVGDHRPSEHLVLHLVLTSFHDP
jgi:hypothetical protein